MTASKTSIPKSVTSMGINLFAVLGYGITLRILIDNNVALLWSVIIPVVVLAATIAIPEWVLLRKQSKRASLVTFSGRNRIDLQRVVIKLLGFYATLFLVALFYLIFPVYNLLHFGPYFKFTACLLPVLLIGGIPYFILLDMFMKEPRDSYWHAGMLVMGRLKVLDRKVLKHHFLGWLVKAFFLPIMFGALLNNTAISFQSTYSFPWDAFFRLKWFVFLKEIYTDFGVFYPNAVNFIFSVDLLFITAGYLLTLKIFDSHIRTVEPTLFGWLTTLLCYPPFNGFIMAYFLWYGGDSRWLQIFENNHGMAFRVYGLVILALFSIYALASVAFGLRFSNLTNRGIITNGPYRYMKHPAYIAKNLAWWLASVPFLFYGDWQTKLQVSLMLLGLNFIYYLRAITEERHLSLDPTYVQYATALNEKGIFRGLYRRFPFLRYDVRRYIDEEGKLKKLWF